MGDPREDGDADESAGVSDDERKRLLARAVQELTREWRASVRTWGDFEDLLVRGTPVNHRLHLAGVVAAAVISVLAVAIVPGLGLGYAALALIGFLAPATRCLWAMLTGHWFVGVRPISRFSKG